jgi:hypothetical protein
VNHREAVRGESGIMYRTTSDQRIGRTELSSFDWAQAKEAALDIKIWLFLVMAAGIYVCRAGDARRE